MTVTLQYVVFQHTFLLCVHLCVAYTQEPHDNTQVNQVVRSTFTATQFTTVDDDRNCVIYCIAACLFPPLWFKDDRCIDACNSCPGKEDLRQCCCGKCTCGETTCDALCTGLEVCGCLAQICDFCGDCGDCDCGGCDCGGCDCGDCNCD